MSIAFRMHSSFMKRSNPLKLQLQVNICANPSNVSKIDLWRSCKEVKGTFMSLEPGPPTIINQGSYAMCFVEITNGTQCSVTTSPFKIKRN
jgi:hypothetical protein